MKKVNKKDEHKSLRRYYSSKTYLLTNPEKPSRPTDLMSYLINTKQLNCIISPSLK